LLNRNTAEGGADSAHNTLNAGAWLAVLSLAFAAWMVALSGRADAVEPRPYAPSDELEKALALSPKLAHGASLHRAYCAKCHGTEGWGTAGEGRTPTLAGQHYQYLVKQIADLRRGELGQDRGAFHVATLEVLREDQAIADVAAYLSGLKPNPRPRAGHGDRLREGGEIYDRLCRDCHLDSGDGEAILFTPRISAQHYEYVLQQLEDFAAGHRLNAPPEVLDLAAALSAEQRAAVADYVSRLARPTAAADQMTRAEQISR
jgi:cytochrome c553